MVHFPKKHPLDRAAFKMLGFDGEPDSITVEEVDTRWRELRSALHPDKATGDAVRFHECNLAYKAARFYALQPKPCNNCEGLGKINRNSSRGFAGAKLYINCSRCRGSGLK
jgi:DnaJ-class molecular chaperone